MSDHRRNVTRSEIRNHPPLWHTRKEIIMSDDMNRAGLLLHICDLASQWPKLNGLTSLAMAELEEMSKSAEEELADRRAKAKQKAEDEAAKKQAELAAQAKAEEEDAARKAEASERARAQYEAQRTEANKPAPKVYPEGQTQDLTEDPVVERRI